MSDLEFLIESTNHDDPYFYQVGYNRKRYFTSLFNKWKKTRKDQRPSRFKKTFEVQNKCQIDIEASWYCDPFGWKKFTFATEQDKMIFLLKHAAMETFK